MGIKKKNPVGRPTKYVPIFAKQIVEYFEAEIAAKRLPFLSRFARNVMGVCEDTAIEYTKEYPEFSEAYKKAKNIQKEFLIEQGLSGDYNATAFIFTAKNITDMRDKQEFDHSGSMGIVILPAKE